MSDQPKSKSSPHENVLTFVEKCKVIKVEKLKDKLQWGTNVYNPDNQKIIIRYLRMFFKTEI